MRRSYDVVIVGGGVIGSSVAHFLTSNPDFDGTVMVVERDPTYAASSSSLSVSAIRQQFGTRPNIEMSGFGIEFLRDLSAQLGIDGEGVDIGLREPGYLLLGTSQQVAGFSAKREVQRSFGFEAELLDTDALAARFPWLNTAGLAIGSFGPEREGWFDGPALLQAFRRKARRAGATYVAGEVAGIETAPATGVTAVILADGEHIGCGTLVNAAGPWAGGIAAMAGLHLPVVPRKRCVFVLDCPAKLADAPFVIDASGFYIRPEGHLYLCGITPEVENHPEDFGLEVDYSLFEDRLWPALAERIPAFEQLRMLRAWAGLYEHNTFDHSAIIGRHPDLTNLVFVNGFSGHGMMHSPAAGRGVSELITYGEYRTLDLHPFSLERIAANQPIAEDVY